MKNSIKFLLSGCILSVMMDASFAQQQSSKMLPVVTITSTKVNISDQVRESFVKVFGDVKNAKWYTMNKNYLVKFIKDDQEHNALYKNDGGLIYHVSYGFEKHLPAGIRSTIKLKYPDFTIARTFNIRQDSRTIWLINLENSQSMVLARAENGELQEVDRFKNSSVREESLTEVKH